jgi:hypothetical protein
VRRWIGCRLVRRWIGRRLVRRIVAVFILFFSKNYLQSITDSINDFGINVADLEAWMFW